MNPMGGLINKTLMALLLVQDPIRFFSDSRWAIWSVTFITGWKLIGFSTLIFSARCPGLTRNTSKRPGWTAQGAGKLFGMYCCRCCRQR